MTVNNEDRDADFDLPADSPLISALSGRRVSPEGGRVRIRLDGFGGDIWIPDRDGRTVYEPVRRGIPKETPQAAHAEIKEPRRAPGKALEEMTVEELQAEVLAKLASNGPVTDRMRRDVTDNVYRDSLLNWIKSFR